MSKNWQPYFSQRVKNLFSSLQHWSDDSDPTSLHDLRVEIKKLMAVFRFLRKEYPDLKLNKEKNAVKRIFQELGQLREYHLLEEWLAHQHLDLIQNTCFPHKDVKALSKELVKKANRFSKSLKQGCEKIEPFVSEIHDDSIAQYMKGLFIEIKKMCSKDMAIEEWHPLRKKIKQYIYASNWLPAKANPKNEKMLDGFHTLEEAIGEWHDMERIRETLMQRQLYLSKDLSLQLCFTQASDQLKRSIQYRKRKITLLLSQQ